MPFSLLKVQRNSTAKFKLWFQCKDNLKWVANFFCRISSCKPAYFNLYVNSFVILRNLSWMLYEKLYSTIKTSLKDSLWCHMIFAYFWKWGISWKWNSKKNHIEFRPVNAWTARFWLKLRLKYKKLKRLISNCRLPCVCTKLAKLAYVWFLAILRIFLICICKSKIVPLLNIF